MNLVIFDLETTGFSPHWNDIIQIAAVRMRDGEISDRETFSTYVRPRRPIPRHITGLTGITDADVATAPDAARALQDFAHFAAGQNGAKPTKVGDGHGDITLVAHNGHRFDMPFIAANCARHALPVHSLPFIDSMWLSKKLWPAERLHNLDAIAERLGLTGDETTHPRHDARADVRLLATAVRCMVQNLFPIAPAKRLEAEACEHDFITTA